MPLLRTSQLGFKFYDALHLAFAEAGGADVLLTTDDRLLRKAQQIRRAG
ncbi:MAG: type II toxin-antitoxin system VapC family toxin [Microcystis aeruginosa W11-06]|nr:type II toxin-antitoxin system VapC family toxin [Microcystis aeruginosa W11-03]NCR71659.1 type II toxin-antitoxin system VapC family toxin [Microcystis aeruginosa LG13-12]NCR93167.1 type II toxin-antitoxin system VapC family toxin [Microcystis aeruginosa W11-06]